MNLDLALSVDNIGVQLSVVKLVLPLSALKLVLLLSFRGKMVQLHVVVVRLTLSTTKVGSSEAVFMSRATSDIQL